MSIELAGVTAGRRESAERFASEHTVAQVFDSHLEMVETVQPQIDNIACANLCARAVCDGGGVSARTRDRMPRPTTQTPWADGTTSLMLSPTELIVKLAALVPPARLNLIRYHGVLAPAAADRAQIVPGPRSLTEVREDGGGGQAGEAPRHRQGRTVHPHLGAAQCQAIRSPEADPPTDDNPWILVKSRSVSDPRHRQD